MIRTSLKGKDSSQNSPGIEAVGRNPLHPSAAIRPDQERVTLMLIELVRLLARQAARELDPKEY